MALDVKLISIRYEGHISFFKAFGKFQKILWNLTTLGSTLYLNQRMHTGLNISPSIW